MKLGFLLVGQGLQLVGNCWWFRNPAHQLRLVGYPIIYEGFSTIPGGCLGFLNHQQYQGMKIKKQTHLDHYHSRLVYLATRWNKKQKYIACVCWSFCMGLGLLVLWSIENVLDWEPRDVAACWLTSRLFGLQTSSLKHSKTKTNWVP